MSKTQRDLTQSVQLAQVLTSRGCESKLDKNKSVDEQASRDE